MYYVENLLYDMYCMYVCMKVRVPVLPLLMTMVVGYCTVYCDVICVCCPQASLVQGCKPNFSVKLIIK